MSQVTDTLQNALPANGKFRSELPRAEAGSRPSGGSDLWRTLRKHWIPAIAVTTAVFSGVTLWTVTQAPKYQSESLILLDQKTTSPVALSLSPGNGNAPITPEMSQNLSTEIEILRSRPLIARALRQLGGAGKNIDLEAAANNLSVRQAGEADVLIVSYTDTDPQRAKAVLDALGATYVKYSLETKRSQATNGIKFIEAKLPEARQALGKSASAIRVFRQHNKVIDPDSFATEVSDAKKTLLDKAYEAKITLGQAKRQDQVLRRQMAEVGQDPGTALADSVLNQDSTYQKLVNQLRGIEIEYAQKSIRLQEAHPVLQDLRTARNNTLKLIQRQARRVLGNKVSQVDLSRARTSAPTVDNAPISQPAVVSSSNQSSATTPDSRSTQQALATQLLQVQTNLAVQTAQL
ncbi:MAG TPA: Wzz/FepE/Etk N-terminal domain-containing protein, partial [Candidatus Caenarcaniphilales bacterium]